MIVLYKYGSTAPRAILDTISDDSKQSVGLMREDVLNLSITVTEALNFQIGDYCQYFSSEYQINKLPTRTRNQAREIVYNLILEADWYDFGKVDFLLLNNENIFTEAVFPLRNTLLGFGELLIENMKRVYPNADWKLGTVEDSQFQDLNFSGVTCLEALPTIVEAFNTEYIFEGKTLHLYRKQISNGLVLEHGNAITKLTEQDQDSQGFITRLWVFGSQKNIPNNYRGGLQSLRIGNVPYIEKNTNLYRISEGVVIFDGTNGLPEIYPHRTGTITSVDSPFTFHDAGIDFDLNNGYLIPGTSAKVVFNTGLLSGYTFEIAENGFSYTDKKITILPNKDETAFPVPSDTIKPAVGDTYVLIDIYMPQSYITAAENELKLAAQNYLDQHSVPPVKYTCECDQLYFQQENIQIQIGETAQVKDDGFQLLKSTRITSFTRSINNPYLYTIELSDTVPAKSLLIKLLNNNGTNK